MVGDDHWEASPGAGKARWLLAALLLVLVALVAVRAPFRAGDGWLQVGSGDRQTVAPPTPGETAGTAPRPVPPAVGVWIGVPPPPVTWLRAPCMVSTGREVLVWGAAGDGAAGATFQPSSRTWRPMPEGPLEAREGHVAVWVPRSRGEVGEGEMIVLGGRPLRGDRRGDSAGAAFDPRTASWRPIAEAPMRIPRGASAAWTGSELIVTAGATLSTSESQPPGAAYDPSTDTWRPLPALPPGTWLDGIAWTGAQTLALLGQPGKQTSASVAAWDARLGAWMPHPAAPVGIASSAAALSTGRGAVLWARSSDGLSRLWLLDAAGERWTATESAPLSDRTRPLLGWTGRHVVVLGGTDARGSLPDGAVYDTVEERWYALPAPPRSVPRPLALVWTGREVVVVGYPERGRSSMLAAAWAPATLRP